MTTTAMKETKQQMSKGFVFSPASSAKSFTLIELIVVIIIVGILAAVGMTQYRKVVERGRGAEARMILGQISKLAYEYYLVNGTITGITNADVNIGTTPVQIPYSCRSTHYFYYRVQATSPTLASAVAWRCTTNGKEPQGLPEDSTMCASCRVLQLNSDYASGSNVWIKYGVY